MDGRVIVAVLILVAIIAAMFFGTTDRVDDASDEAAVGAAPQDQATALINGQARAAELLSNGLPRRVNATTTLIEAVSEGPKLIYIHELDLAPGSDVFALSQRLRRTALQTACQHSGMRKVLEAGGLYSYRYFDKNGPLISEFLIMATDCR